MPQAEFIKIGCVGKFQIRQMPVKQLTVFRREVNVCRWVFFEAQQSYL